MKKVFEQYVALVRMIESGDVLKLDQEQLETVIPNIGGRVLVVNGAYRGESATLSSVNVEEFNAQIKLETGSHMGLVVAVDYADISKIYK